jgi:hypothetical protein
VTASRVTRHMRELSEFADVRRINPCDGFEGNVIDTCPFQPLRSGRSRKEFGERAQNAVPRPSFLLGITMNPLKRLEMRAGMRPNRSHVI